MYQRHTANAGYLNRPRARDTSKMAAVESHRAAGAKGSEANSNPASNRSRTVGVDKVEGIRDWAHGLAGANRWQ